LKKSRKSRSKKKDGGGRGKITGEYVKVVDRGSKRCVLCGRRFKSDDVKVMIGGDFRYAHMECVARYSFSIMD